MLLAIEGVLEELVQPEGPFWNQKLYVAFRKNNFNWLAVHTRPTLLAFDFHVRTNTFTQAEIASDLDVVEFDAEEELSEKLNLPSSVTIKSINERRDRVRIRAKEGFDVTGGTFRALIVKAWAACPK